MLHQGEFSFGSPGETEGRRLIREKSFALGHLSTCMDGCSASVCLQRDGYVAKRVGVRMLNASCLYTDTRTAML